MKTANKGIQLIKDFEGVRLNAYLDSVKVPTIGYGHTLGGKMGQKITLEQAENMLKQDLAIYERGVSSLVKVPLNQNQFDALVSFAFNLGVGALQNSTLLKKLNHKNYLGAADEFLKWVNAGGQKLQGLVRRRTAERSLFLS